MKSLQQFIIYIFSPVVFSLNENMSSLEHCVPCCFFPVHYYVQDSQPLLIFSSLLLSFLPMSPPGLSLCVRPLERTGSQSLLLSKLSSRKLHCQVDYHFPSELLTDQRLNVCLYLVPTLCQVHYIHSFLPTYCKGKYYSFLSRKEACTSAIQLVLSEHRFEHSN